LLIDADGLLDGLPLSEDEGDGLLDGLLLSDDEGEGLLDGLLLNDALGLSDGLLLIDVDGLLLNDVDGLLEGEEPVRGPILVESSSAIASKYTSKF
jgi:hypothetical protein